MQKLVKEAKEFAGIKPDTIIDEEERYYNRGAVEKYEAFLAGANCAYNKFIEKACEKLDSMLYMRDCGDYDCVASSCNTVEDFIELFKELMEE
jgi:hypothetical protein